MDSSDVVIVWLRYHTDAIGDLCRDDEVLDETYRWSDAIETALNASGTGECIINEYGGGKMYEIYSGPDTSKLWTAIREVVVSLPALPDSRAEVNGQEVWRK